MATVTFGIEVVEPAERMAEAGRCRRRFLTTGPGSGREARSERAVAVLRRRRSKRESRAVLRGDAFGR